MSNSFISTALAHDIVCPKGQEWCFHGFTKPDIHSKTDDSVIDNISPENSKLLKCGCIAAFIVIAAFIALTIWCIA